MTYLNTALVDAWTNTEKVTWAAVVDESLDSQVASQVLARVSKAFDTSTWIDTDTTPRLILSIIAMNYVGRKFQEMYGDDSLNSDYGTAIITDANNLLINLLAGDLILTDEDGLPIDPTYSVGSISFEPLESDPMFSVEMRF